MREYREKVVDPSQLAAIAREARQRGLRAVFTNGCFDLLHVGHIACLAHARNLGDYLIVAVNSDASVKRLKGVRRPLVPQEERALILASLECVDYVTVFEEDNPTALLEAVRPEVYVKGGDYASQDIAEAHIVRAYGGEVVLAPHLEGRSTTDLIRRVLARYGETFYEVDGQVGHTGLAAGDPRARARAILSNAALDSLRMHQSFLSGPLADAIVAFACRVADALAAGHKVLAFGNGGSAADAQHLVAELVGRFTVDRRALPAISLSSDVAVISAVANDYEYAEIFSRQVEALAGHGDIVVAISTSGNSRNVLSGLDKAKRKGAYTVGLLGRDGGAAREKCDLPVVVPNRETARIQEAHGFIIHVVCQVVEELLAQRGWQPG